MSAGKSSPEGLHDDPFKRRPNDRQRQSCLPCRRRKSKCDRVQPCSSCVLRDTQKFCYTSASVEDMKPASSSGKADERQKRSLSGHGYDPSGSTPRSSVDGADMLRTAAKIRRTTADRSEHGLSGADSAVGPRALHRRSLLSRPRSEDEIDRAAVMNAIQSIQSTLSTLQGAVGHPDKGTLTSDEIPPTIRWEEARDMLPTREQCDIILDCFVTHNLYLWPFVNGQWLLRDWQDFASDKPVRRTVVALAMVCMGVALFLAPISHPASQLPCRKDHKLFVERAYQVILPISSPFVILPETADFVQVQTAVCFYLSMNGYLDQGYREQGKLLRYARCISLFDEDKWDFATMSDWDIEVRRRMALIIKLLERWMCLNFLRLPVLPLVTKNETPSLYADECYDYPSGKLNPMTLKFSHASVFYTTYDFSSPGAYKVNHYLSDFLKHSPTERYNIARELDGELIEVENQIPKQIRYDTACDLASLTSPDAIRSACQALIIYTTLKRLRCTIMRQFLLDREAPVDLRMAGLEQAKCIIETVPVLIALSSNPWSAMHSSWCSGHLFCAASTFALVYLGESDQLESSAELDWFASKIFEVVDTLGVLSVKDRVAQRCEELLFALCTSRSTLRSKYIATRNGGGFRTKKAMFEGEESEKAKNIVDFHQKTWPAVADVISMDGEARTLQDGKKPSPSPIVSKERPTTQPIAPLMAAAPSANNGIHLNRAQHTSPEAYPSMTATPNTSSSGGRNSLAEEQASEYSPTPFVPPLNDAQWSALVDSLNGDWASMTGAAMGSLSTNGGTTMGPFTENFGFSAAPTSQVQPHQPTLQSTMPATDRSGGSDAKLDPSTTIAPL